MAFALFDRSAARFKIVRNILITTVTSDSTGKATITIPAGLSGFRIYLAQAMGYVVRLDWTYDSTTGNLTLTFLKPVVSTVTATFVAGISKSTAAVVSAVTPQRGYITTTKVTVVTGVSVTTTQVIGGVAYGYITTVKTSVLSGVTPLTAPGASGIALQTAAVVSAVGDDVGRWTVDAAGNLSHTHAVSTIVAVTGISVTTAAFVTGLSTATVSVVSDITTGTAGIAVVTSAAGAVVVGSVSALTGSAVSDITTGSAGVAVLTGVSVSTAVVLADVAPQTGSAVISASIAYEPIPNTSFELIIMW
jgi:hypothetical protein